LPTRLPALLLLLLLCTQASVSHSGANVAVNAKAGSRKML
jgi:hypothetical protein